VPGSTVYVVEALLRCPYPLRPSLLLPMGERLKWRPPLLKQTVQACRVADIPRQSFHGAPVPVFVAASGAEKRAIGSSHARPAFWHCLVRHIHEMPRTPRGAFGRSPMFMLWPPPRDSADMSSPWPGQQARLFHGVSPWMYLKRRRHESPNHRARAVLGMHARDSAPQLYRTRARPRSQTRRPSINP